MDTPTTLMVLSPCDPREQNAAAPLSDLGAGKGVRVMKFMERFGGETYAALRIVAGLLFLAHGMQKLFGYPPMPAGYPSPPALIIFIAGPIEFFGGLLIALGLFTRQAAFLCAGLMAFAYWMAHGPKHWLPLINQGELAVVYCFLFLFISANGPGRCSIDTVRA
jgi:putative oxidoreductase